MFGLCDDMPLTYFNLKILNRVCVSVRSNEADLISSYNHTHIEYDVDFDHVLRTATLDPNHSVRIQISS
jgi:hypothetical protein